MIQIIPGQGGGCERSEKPEFRPLAQPSWTSFRPILVILPAVGLAAGLTALWARPGWAAPILTAATLPVLAVLVVQIVTSLRRGDMGLDIVAALSMTAALLSGEQLAATVVALMYSGGQYLELFAERRARRDMTALLSRVPRGAMRHGAGGLEEVPLDLILPGDRLLIRPGDVVPVDGCVLTGTAVLDESALTGEAMPVRHPVGEAIVSGPSNVGDAFDLVAVRLARESTLAGIVRMVEAAQGGKAPMTRLADRYALWFLGLTLAITGLAWGISGDPIRAVAVLVIATPCPLILAVPVALVAGLSRAAGQGILIKGGAALETLAGVTGMILDKTGTLTEGRARVVGIHPAEGYAALDVLRCGAALDQSSKHAIARSLVAEARARGLDLPLATETVEVPGEGVRGRVEGCAVAVGGRAFVRGLVGRGPDFAEGDHGAVVVGVGMDGVYAGEIYLADPLRADARDLLATSRRMGLRRIVLATGDRRAVAEALTAGLGLDAIHADLAPGDKVAVVRAEQAFGPVMMIGDGINDAPALAAADLGVAMGARGAAASAEAADVVLLVDRLDPVLAAIAIARRSRRIAVQSVVAGIGLSVLGMTGAAFGLFTPVQGALLQEAIDVAAILNALRALRGS